MKGLGSATSTVSTADQTATALFYSGNAIAQFNAAVRDQVLVRHLDIVEAARLFAAVDMSAADTFISVWYAKLKYGLWRPDTAINLADTDGNPGTTADPTWTPLESGSRVSRLRQRIQRAGRFIDRGAVARAVHSHRLRVTLISTAVPGTRNYDSGAALRSDVVNGRMWLGVYRAKTRRVALSCGCRSGGP